jgi:hypothetical protein
MLKDRNTVLRDHYGQRDAKPLRQQLREKPKPKVERIGEGLKQPVVKL